MWMKIENFCLTLVTELKQKVKLSRWHLDSLWNESRVGFFGIFSSSMFLSCSMFLIHYMSRRECHEKRAISRSFRAPDMLLTLLSKRHKQHNNQQHDTRKMKNIFRKLALFSHVYCSRIRLQVPIWAREWCVNCKLLRKKIHSRRRGRGGGEKKES